MIIDQIRARAGVDDIGAALAIDGLRARTARDGVGAGRAQDRERPGQTRRLDILEVLDRRRTRHILVGRGEIEAHRRRQNQSAVAARAAVDRAFQTVVIDDVRG